MYVMFVLKVVIGVLQHFLPLGVTSYLMISYLLSMMNVINSTLSDAQ